MIQALIRLEMISETGLKVGFQHFLDLFGPGGQSDIG